MIITVLLLNEIMKKLYSNLEKIKYFEIESFDLNEMKTIWKPRNSYKQNKVFCDKLINGYQSIWIKNNRAELLFDFDAFYSKVSEIFETIDNTEFISTKRYKFKL